MYSQLLRATLLLIFGIRKGLADDGLDSRSAGWMVVRAYREIAQHATIQVFINKEYGFCGEHYLGSLISSFAVASAAASYSATRR